MEPYDSGPLEDDEIARAGDDLFAFLDSEERLEALLLEGLNSGAPVEVTAEYWERKRVDLVARHRKRDGG